MTKVRPTLLALARVIADECDQNAPFRMRIEEIISPKPLRAPKPKSQAKPVARPHRRSPAVLDPIELAKISTDHLRNRLGTLDIEQLKDIVAQYGMDTSKLVMKWKDAKRVADHITETSTTRAAKGDAFRA